jgi:hypothetical protein
MAVDQRGFRVSAVSQEDLADVIVIRITIEYEALRRSMSLGDDAWEPAAIAAFHRLKYSIERTQPDRSFTTEEFETLHKSFHTALIAGCESARLLELHSDLYDQAARYRSLAAKTLFESAGLHRGAQVPAGFGNRARSESDLPPFSSSRLEFELPIRNNRNRRDRLACAGESIRPAGCPTAYRSLRYLLSPKSYF